ncbi:MAG: UDP-N-acetylglucosamine--LPS N-acetylglucosamine transferase [Cyanobacteria bacterium RI_101]|nr:UDP-N-acetylglucosamine--LPS N-acetylglucosamine transferase [Cyanobacteria bacterium RI_101]
MKLLLISSTGGHFNALLQLSSFWQQHERRWVTFKSATTEKALEKETVRWAYGPTNRNLPNLFRNLRLAARVLFQERPDVVLTTGAGVAVPFIILAKVLGIQTVFVESYTRVNELSLSAKLALPFTDHLYVHWDSLQKKYPQAQLIRA